MEQSQGVKTWQWVVTVIVIIALIIVGIYVFSGSKTEAPGPVSTVTPSVTDNETTNRVIMNDQFPGNFVYISSVQATNPSWVAIQKDNAGVPGKVIGYAHVDAGISPVKVTLSEPTIDGGTYYAVMHTDDGDTTFDATKDVPLKDANGNVVMKMFRATATASLEIKG